MPPNRAVRSPLAVAVGEQVRALRRERGLSMDEVARRSGLGKGTLSELETGRRNPTLETLFALTTALGVPISAALPAPETASEGGRTTIVGEAIEAVLVARFDDISTTTELYRISIPAGRTQHSAAHAPGVTEHWMLFAGTLVLGPMGAEIELAGGESASFQADVDHHYAAGNDEDVAATLVVRYPR
jgi:XRE family transcriptional regulator, regulator of sulfur utilization